MEQGKVKAEGAKPVPAEFAYQDNPIIAGLPGHLKQFIVDQNYPAYTPVNHAVWRYVMRQNFAFLKDHAHEAYVEGLRKTGIGIEKIPSIEDMNEILGQIGWAAVPVDGFIPPAAFMEFQAHNVLVIAADMRQLNHIDYTPAPDIIHEAAGHAPIIADPEYAEYLRRIGFIGSKAMSSRKDYELYEAIRHLSILKELDDPDPEEVKKAEADVEFKQENLGDPSEMARLSRLHWWTVEYGLIGDLDDPRIYGAGLLSSIGESASCLKPAVKKLPYNLDTQNYAFDITTQQPHLFVTPDFKHLTAVLEEFAESMAFRVGGCEGLSKAIECKAVSTAEYSSGLQVSGIFTECRCVRNAVQPYYIKTTGPSALALEDSEIPGHGTEHHADGFGSPVGKLKNESVPLEDFSEGDLSARGITAGTNVVLEFESGVKVRGHLESALRHGGKLVMMRFTNCRVTRNHEVLFDPDWGVYDMAVGESIVSVFAGAADKTAYQQPSLVAKERTVKAEYSDATRRLFELYQRVRDIREDRAEDSGLAEIWAQLKADGNQWLLPLEILEIITERGVLKELAPEIRRYLEEKAESRSEWTTLIRDGLALISESESRKQA